MKWKISSKIMVAIMISSAALAAIIGSIALFQASNVIEKSALNNLQAIAKSYAKEFSITTVKVESVLDSYIASITSTIDYQALKEEKDEYAFKFQEEELLPLTKKFAENTEGILGIYFDIDPAITPNLREEQSVYGAWYLDKYLDGTIVRESMELKKNFYPSNKELQWYYDPIMKNSGVWSKPYKDIYTDHYMISYNKPVYMKNTLIGVAGIDIIFEDIISMVESVTVFESGYAFLLNEDLDFIVHPEIEMSVDREYKNLSDFEGIAYAPLAKEISENHSGIAEMGQGYNKKLAGFAHMDNGYLVVIEVNALEILEDLNKVRSIIDAIILVGILVSAIAAYTLGKFISKPVERLGKMIKRMMHYDFSSEIDDTQLVNIHSDSGRMIKELSKLRESVNHAITKIRDNSSKMNVSEEKIEKLMENSKALLEKIELLYHMESTPNSTISKDIEQQKILILEIETLVRDIKTLNEENTKIADLFKID
ncbi:MAG: hypothetical protein MJA31_19195 [Clostridia bacterium]|nr:hypothetical protein [Clostridia bacterium]